MNDSFGVRVATAWLTFLGYALGALFLWALIVATLQIDIILGF